MSVDTKEMVDTTSTEFTEGVEAGLNSEEDTKNWKAGNDLGQALKEDGATEEPVLKSTGDETPTPLFLRDSRRERAGNDQDEKDGTVE
jgi:hypothetical protein